MGLDLERIDSTTMTWTAVHLLVRSVGIMENNTKQDQILEAKKEVRSLINISLI